MSITRLLDIDKAVTLAAFASGASARAMPGVAWRCFVGTIGNGRLCPARVVALRVAAKDEPAAAFVTLGLTWRDVRS